MQAAIDKYEAKNPRDNAPSAGQIKNLGLLGKEEESKKTLEQLRGKSAS